MSTRKLAVTANAALLALSVGLAATSHPAFAASSLTLFHNNDGESKLLGADVPDDGSVGDFGRFSHFLGTFNSARTVASGAGRDVISLTSGDNILAGLTWNASVARRGDLSNPITGPFNNYYDALALTALDYDAIVFGNHDFDFGPDILADFLGGYVQAGGDAKWLSSNLDFSAQANLQDFVDSGVIASSTIVMGDSGEKYGIIGATTEDLPTISSPGAVAVSSVVDAVNAEVTALEGQGVNKIILSSHLQGIANEQALIPQLSGVDIVVAGGGSEILSNDPDIERNFGEPVVGPYPFPATPINDADDNPVYIVGTGGDYRYIGELEVEFDADGVVTSVSGDPIVVTDESPSEDGVVNGVNIREDIIIPLQAVVQFIKASPVTSTNVPLDGLRSSVRTKESNLGSLIADAFVFQAQERTTLTGDAVVGLTNGGGIRNNSIIDAGTQLTEGDVINILPFPNDITVLREVSVADLVEALEHAVSNVENVSGRFAQVSGLQFEYNPSLAAGSRILRVALEGTGELLYTAADGVVSSLTIDVVTNSFLAAGGDGYDVFTSQTQTGLSVAYSVALSEFLQSSDPRVADLAANYPEMGLDRISAVPLPAAFWMLAPAAFGLGVIRRRNA